MKYRHIFAALAAVCQLASCGGAEPAESGGPVPRQNEPALEAKPAEPVAPPVARNASGLFPECGAYIERLKSCYGKLPDAEAAPYRATLKETADSLKQADAASCKNINLDFNQTAKTLRCE